MHDNSNETQNGKLKQQETKAKPRVAKTKWKTSATEKYNRKQQKQQVMLEQTENKNEEERKETKEAGRSW